MAYRRLFILFFFYFGRQPRILDATPTTRISRSLIELRFFFELRAVSVQASKYNTDVSFAPKQPWQRQQHKGITAKVRVGFFQQQQERRLHRETPAAI
jgi:hypothetical protein